jgi:Domain of unknown function (DUF4265)
MVDANERKQVKAVFRIDEGPAETMWADLLADGTYRLGNIPLFAYGINLGDTFTATFFEGDERPYLDRVTHRSGNRTFRITLGEDLPTDAARRLQEIRTALDEVSSGHSSYGPDYLVYNVAPGKQRTDVERLLDVGEDEGLWSWELSVPIGEA